MAWDDTKDAEDLIRSNEWNNMVTDQKGRVIGTSISEVIADTAANLPAAGTTGRIFFETDTGRTLYDNGTSWVEVGLSESQISFTNIQDTIHDNTQHSEAYVTTAEDVTNFDGSTGTAGEFLTTNGTSLSFASPPKGMTKSERQAFNDLMTQMARNDFEDNLSELNYDGGFYDIFRDTSKIATQTDVVVSTLEGGDPRGKVELGTSYAGSYDITNAVNTETLSTGTPTPTLGVSVYENGNSAFIGNNGNVYKYSLSESYNISTATQTQSQSLNERTFGGYYFANQGTKMYVAGDTDSGSFDQPMVLEYDLSTSYDITTASFNDSFTTSFTSLYDIWVTENGGRLAVVDSGGTIASYTFGTNYDVTTLTQESTFATGLTTPSGIEFNSDGTSVKVLDRSDGTINQWALSTAYDVSTASNKETFTDSNIGTGYSLHFADSGRKLYTADNDDAEIRQYEFTPTEKVSSGSFTTVSVDLSTDANGGFTSAPQSWVLSQDADLPTNTDIQYVLRDGNGNTVTATQSDVDTEIDTSNLTSTTIEIDGQLSTSDTSVTPSLYDHSHHFQS